MTTNLEREEAGDYERLFRDAAPALWRTLYAFTGGRAQIADDAVAEAFARALSSRKSIRQPVPWLYRVALRVASAEMKRQRAQVALQTDPAVEAREDLRDVVAALRELSPSQRAAVVLHYQADLPVKDVADRMGTSVAAVKVHLHRGRKRLRLLLGEEEIADA